MYEKDSKFKIRFKGPGWEEGKTFLVDPGVFLSLRLSSGVEEVICWATEHTQPIGPGARMRERQG